jgi:hypothetical protein
MGKNNSSETRVAPVVRRLFERDPSGATWLDTLLTLGSRAEVVASVPRENRLIPNHRPLWGEEEAILPAPLSLLEYLVSHVEADRVDASQSSGNALAKRRALADKDPGTINEALAAIRSGRRGRHWFILEGESRPDALLETDRFVLCVEGKRTEEKCTTDTTWMPMRSQLLRHMDAAMDKFPAKQIYGLLVIEGDDSDPMHPSAHWRQQCEQQYDCDVVERSLPHRTAAERAKIADGILGVTTWQAVCDRVGIEWPLHVDAV